MSNTNGSTPAGWYADPSGSQQLRWWDGLRWTEHYTPAKSAPTSQPAAPAYGQAGYGQPGYGQAQYSGAAGAPYTATFAPVRPQLAPGAPIYNVFIWLVVLLPLVPAVLLLFWNPFADFSQIRYTHGLRTIPNPYAMLGWGYYLNIGLSWLVYGVTVVFAWLDHRRLVRSGVVRPFHWAWSFLSPLVYVIGRSIIVRRVAPGRGLVPIWASIGVIVVGVVIAIFWVAMFVNSLAVHMTPGAGSYGA